MTAVNQMKIRLPIEVNDWVHEKAKKDSRSLNYIVVETLKEAKKLDESKKNIKTS